MPVAEAARSLCEGSPEAGGYLRCGGRSGREGMFASPAPACAAGSARGVPSASRVRPPIRPSPSAPPRVPGRRGAGGRLVAPGWPWRPPPGLRPGSRPPPPPAPFPGRDAPLVPVPARRGSRPPEGSQGTRPHPLCIRSGIAPTPQCGYSVSQHPPPQREVPNVQRPSMAHRLSREPQVTKTSPAAPAARTRKKTAKKGNK
jgi:hypothetical protein